jgi:hypothetical protein
MAGKKSQTAKQSKQEQHGLARLCALADGSVAGAF